MLAIPASAVALAATQADAQSAIQLTLHPREVPYGQQITVHGTASPSEAGQSADLQFVPSGATRWQSLSSTHVGGDGHFKLVAHLRRSGLVRVSVAGTSQSTPTPVASAALVPPSGAASSSAAQRVAVEASLRVPSQSINVLEGQQVDIRGHLLPGKAGRRVQLRGANGSGWQTLATATTGRYGGFDLRYTPSATGQESLRVRFQGDRVNTKSWAHAGQVTVYRTSVASWYNDGGSTACGFHAFYGVANRDLPCGTKVTFRYGGRSVTATVDDRGPFVGGREWDLNQNTAGALGFGGVDTVWSSV